MTALRAFDGVRFHALFDGIFFEPLGNALHLAIRTARRHDKIFSNGCMRANIQHDQIISLSLQRARVSNNVFSHQLFSPRSQRFLRPRR